MAIKMLAWTKGFFIVTLQKNYFFVIIKIKIMDTKEFRKSLTTDISFLAETFSVKRKSSCGFLNNWLDVSGNLQDDDLRLFKRTFEDNKDDMSYWNEEELKIQLIGLLFLIANIQVKNTIKVFYERPLVGTIDGHEVNVVADCIVATPTQFIKPKKPYFFLQEYKKSRGDNKDPECQMLLAMLIAQELNNDNKPIYGSYIFGNRWTFTTLIGKDYCASREYNAADEKELLQIILILRKLKELILNR
jgi:hypothetical protein